MPRDRCRQRPSRERADLQSRIRDGRRGEGRPRRLKPILPWLAISFTRTTGTCERPGVCFRNGRIAGKDLSKANGLLREILASNPDVTRRLRALWALHATGGLGESAAEACSMTRANTFEPGQSACFATRAEPSPDTVKRFAALAKSDPSPKVQLSLASALQRIPLSQRYSVAEPLTRPYEDCIGSIAVLDGLVWCRATCDRPIDRAVSLAAHSEIPLVRRYLARRAVAAEPAPGLAAVISLLKNPPIQVCLDFLTGAREALRGSETHRPT